MDGRRGVAAESPAGGRWRRLLRLVAGTAAVAVLACAPGQDAGTDGAAGTGADTDLPLLPDHGPTARSTAGMVVTGSPHATEAGRRMLAAGGNAVDAAVAAAFTLAVAEPTQSGLGGRTQVLLRTADGQVHAIDGITQVPAGYDPETAPRGEHGHAAVAIPGTVAALTRLQEEHGSLPLERVVEPARRWAAGGLTLTRGEADRFAGLFAELDPSSEAARTFGGPGGTPPEAGSLLVQPELARVLELVGREGRDGFYRGDVAGRLAQDMEANGGFVTLQDLEAYRALDASVGQGRYRGHQVLGSYLPASGVTVVEILQILDRLALPPGQAPWAATVAEALLAGFEDREIAEDLPPAEAVAWLTSDSLADRRAREITERLAILGVDVAPEASGAQAPAGTGRGTPGRDAAVLSRAAAVLGTPEPAPGDAALERKPEPPFTTHLSVTDTLGNVVALTQSLGPTGGARVVTPGLGFLYASTLGGYLSGGGPGYRPWSSQAPLIVLRDDRPWLVMGGAGARRILSALVATVTRMVDRGMTLEEALAAPRIHPTGGRIQVEEGWPGAAGLEGMGYEVEARERSWFARLNVVEVEEGGGFLGAGDRRWRESAAAGPGGSSGR